MKPWMLLSLLLLNACSTVVPIPSAPSTTLTPQQQWQQVLRQHVDAQGRVDFASVASDPDNLHGYVRYAAEISPKATPERFTSRAERIAYHINTYNALSMYNVIQAGIPESLAGFKKVDFFVLTKLTVGGQQISLYDYENDIIRPFGEPRVHFALNCMSIGCPRLPATPFRAETLECQLEAEAQRFFAEARNLRIAHDEQAIYLSEILDFYPEDFVTETTTLIDYINQYVDDPIPAHYKINFTPYDWTVNRQP